MTPPTLGAEHPARAILIVPRVNSEGLRWPWIPRAPRSPVGVSCELLSLRCVPPAGCAARPPARED